MNIQSKSAPLAGFDNAAFDSSRIFRYALDAMSRPGKIVDIDIPLPSPEGLNSATTAVLLTLADMDTPIWLSPEIKTIQAETHIRFHTGCEITENPERATFAIAPANGDLSFLASLPAGNPEMPHLSTTLILLVDGFEGQTPLQLTGPGIQTTTSLSPTPVSAEFYPWAQANQRLFPCGVDTFFAASSSLAALPRSTRMEVPTCM